MSRSAFHSVALAFIDGCYLNRFSSLKSGHFLDTFLLHFLTGLLLEGPFPFPCAFLFTMDLGLFKIQCVIIHFCHFLWSRPKCGQQEPSSSWLLWPFDVSPSGFEHFNPHFLVRGVPGAPCYFFAMVLESAFSPKNVQFLGGKWGIVFRNQDLGAKYAGGHWDSSQLSLLPGPFWQQSCACIV